MHLDIAKEFLKGAEVALANELYRVAPPTLTMRCFGQRRRL